MDMEPSQLIRGMDVDIGMGLGDELGGFEGFDTMFAEPNNTTDFFNLCALEEAQQEQDMVTTSAFSSPPSPLEAFGQHQRGHDFAQESWHTGQQHIQAWPTLTLSASEPSRNPNALLQGSGKPRARKRHDEDEALEAAEDAFPVMKVCFDARTARPCCFFHFFPDCVSSATCAPQLFFVLDHRVFVRFCSSNIFFFLDLRTTNQTLARACVCLRVCIA